MSSLSADNTKRSPPAITVTSATILDQVSPWPSLHADLVRLVGWRVLAGDLLDYVRFRAVCTHWRSSTVCPNDRGIVDPRFHPHRWMILPEGHGLHPGDGKKRFFNPSVGSFVRIRLPLLSDHLVLAQAAGLLLLRPNHRHDTMISLLHPFTGDIVKFPPILPLLASYWALNPGVVRDRRVDLNFVASLSVSIDGTVVLMIVHQDIPRVFFATHGDHQWSVSTWSLANPSTPISFHGRLYILGLSTTCNDGQPIMRLDPPCHDHVMMPSSLPQPTLIATCPVGKVYTFISLVECDSEILVIGFDDQQISTDPLVVYRVEDLVIGKAMPLKSIRGNTIFLGIRIPRSFEEDGILITRSMASSYRTMPTVARDTIVSLRCNVPCQYHLETGKWSKIMGGCVNDGYNMTGGCNCGLIYHMYRCCHCTDAEGSSSNLVLPKPEP